MHLLTPLLHYFTTLTRGDYYGLLSFIGASGGLAVVLQLFKPQIKKLEARYGYDAKKLIVAFLGLMAFTLSVAGDVLSASPQSLQVLGSHTAVIVGLATILYHFGVSPLHARIVKFLQDVETYIDTGQLPKP